MKYSPRFPFLAVLVFFFVLQDEAVGQFVQQGNKLVGTGTVGVAHQGCAISLSPDGNTAILGGDFDNGNAGAAWIFTRSNSVWNQQGDKLVGTGAAGSAWQGYSVSLSADGNTAIVGGYADNNGAGAAWVFTRTGGVWNQQGTKLAGIGAVGSAGQGFSVSLSAGGNTAIVGGLFDDNSKGAAWVFTRTGGVWSQQGNKLVGAGAVGSSGQGRSVSLSSDGNTAIVGGYTDNNSAGAVWVFTRSNGVWSQQGTKLVGTGAMGDALQGVSVSLSFDGNTAIVGGHRDDNGRGAVWVFTRSGGVWMQQGSKLVGVDAAGSWVDQGYSVSLSANGNTAIVGGWHDNSGEGAAWVFTRTGGVWSQQGNKLVGSGATGIAGQGAGVSLSADGNTAIVGGFNDSSGVGAAWVYIQYASSVEEEAWKMPHQFRSEQNYPNPFNPSTTIKYELPKSSVVRLSVFDMLGREVSVLVDERREAGVHEVRFDGSHLASGVYFYRLQAGRFTQTRRLLLLR